MVIYTYIMFSGIETNTISHNNVKMTIELDPVELL